MTILEAFVLGIVQGVLMLVRVNSTAHLVITQAPAPVPGISSSRITIIAGLFAGPKRLWASSTGCCEGCESRVHPRMRLASVLAGAYMSA